MNRSVAAERQPVSWLEGVLVPAFGALASIGLAAGLHWLWPRLSPTVGHIAWSIFLAGPVLVWFKRPVRDRVFAISCAGAVLAVLTIGPTILFLNRLLVDTWLRFETQTAAVAVAMFTFAVATRIRRRPGEDQPA